MKLEFDATTGEIVEREFTPEELVQIELDKQEEEVRLVNIAAKAAQRQALLNRLGITEEEAQLLLS